MRLPTGASRFVFILAHPARHVSAPRYYSPYFRESGLDWHMVPLDIAPEHLAETIRTLANSRSVASVIARVRSLRSTAAPAGSIVVFGDFGWILIPGCVHDETLAFHRNR